MVIVILGGRKAHMVMLVEKGMGLCRRMTKDGPVRMSCCDSNFDKSIWTGSGSGNHVLNPTYLKMELWIK